jgi:hypothetical protein
VLVSTVESAVLAFFTDFAEAMPTQAITARTDETAAPAKPLRSALSEIDELVDYCDERRQPFVRKWAGAKLPLGPEQLGKIQMGHCHP